MTRFLAPAARLTLALALTFNFSLLTAAGQAPKTYTSSEILLGLKKLNVLGSVLYIAAHPDDENTRLLAYLANERLLETGYLSCTRGDGGQNLIGPELREQLGVIRTQELLAARRIDGAQQFFTRANDFGFSKTAQETFTIWDKEQVLADMVWVIRQRRPDVLITRFPPDSRAGHGHHTASAMLAIEAFSAAGDAKRFPEQLQYVQPWQPKRLLWNTGSFFVKPGDDLSKFLKLDAGGYNPLLGQSYGEIAARSRSQHRSQGFGSAAQRGEALEYFTPLREGDALPKELFEGVDLSWNRMPGGAAIGKMVEEVIRKFDPSQPEASVAGLLEIDEQLSALASAESTHRKEWEQVSEEKRKLIAELVKACLGIYLDFAVDSPTITEGSAKTVTGQLIQRRGTPVKITEFGFFDNLNDKAASVPVKIGVPFTKKLDSLRVGFFTLPLESHVYAVKSTSTSQPFWLLTPGTTGMYALPELSRKNPVARSEEKRKNKLKNKPKKNTDTNADDDAWSMIGPSGASGAFTVINSMGPFPIVDGDKWADKTNLSLLNRPENAPVLTGAARVQYGTRELTFSAPVQYKHTDPTLGELYQPLAVVPLIMVNLPAARAYVFADQQPKEVPVLLRAGRAGVAGTLALQVPKGWEISPAKASFSLKNKDEEQTFRFSVKPGKDAAAGRSELRATATVDGQAYSRGIQTINYPHIPTQTLFPEAASPLVKLDVSRGQTQTVGYLMGAGDEVPEALRQLGYTVTLLDPNTDLSLDRLRRFDAVVVGIRAYNTLDQLKAKQPELLRYVEQGGNLVVQYVVARGTVLPEIGPYPMKLSNDRVTVENAPVTFLQPQHRLLNVPNKITADDFKGWVQEQGLYYPSEWDAKYQTVISSADPGEKAKDSAILVADYGKGHYIYTGLSFFRELPAGVPGAYRLLANLVSYGK